MNAEPAYIFKVRDTSTNRIIWFVFRPVPDTRSIGLGDLTPSQSCYDALQARFMIGQAEDCFSRFIVPATPHSCHPNIETANAVAGTLQWYEDHSHLAWNERVAQRLNDELVSIVVDHINDEEGREMSEDMDTRCYPDEELPITVVVEALVKHIDEVRGYINQTRFKKPINLF